MNKLNNIYFNIKNNNYEIKLMWLVLLMTIFLLLFMLISENEDRYETERII
jgi:hypothetical protein